MVQFLPIAMGLAKIVPGILGLFKGKNAEDKANQVVEIAKQITGQRDPQAAVDALTADPALAMQFKEKLLDFKLAMRQVDNDQLEIVNQTIRAELTSKDKINSRWRATFGYCVSLAWLVTFLAVGFAISWAVVKQPENAGTIYNGIGQLLSSTAVLWTVALSILGVAVHKRSRDKETAAGVVQHSVIGSVVSKLTGR
ncbi:MAG: hypothetical protein HKM93_08950 [Desulfobacteraceae bacterium]|nr:hypothetical protein [Desulfobacteraceae bacterium]